jgi:hypothetical protein
VREYFNGTATRRCLYPSNELSPRPTSQALASTKATSSLSRCTVHQKGSISCLLIEQVLNLTVDHSRNPWKLHKTVWRSEPRVATPQWQFALLDTWAAPPTPIPSLYYTPFVVATSLQGSLNEKLWIMADFSRSLEGPMAFILLYNPRNRHIRTPLGC